MRDEVVFHELPVIEHAAIFGMATPIVVCTICGAIIANVAIGDSDGPNLHAQVHAAAEPE